MSTSLSLPPVRIVRERIESCKDKDIQMFLKAEYLFCSRAIEVAGELCSCDKLRGKLSKPYGPRGTDVRLAETSPPDPTWMQFLEMLLKIQGKELSISEAMAQAQKKIPVAVFTVCIAKQHPEPGEPYPYRLVALPLLQEYEPWAQELLDRFNKAGSGYVFPFNRQYVWEYLTRTQRIFEGLTYRIKKYYYLKVKPEVTPLAQMKIAEPDIYVKLIDTPANNRGIVVVDTDECEYRLDFNGKVTKKMIGTSYSHPRKIKNHGLRHVRTDELRKTYGFEGLDFAAMVGWSMNAVNQVSPTPTQVGNYAEIREAWDIYIKKLCRKNPNNGAA